MFIRINLKKLFYKQTKRLYIKHKETSSDNNSEQLWSFPVKPFEHPGWFAKFENLCELTDYWKNCIT